MTLQKNAGRIESIDVLRGFTLFGIAIIHMVEQYYAGPVPEKVQVHGTLADGIVEGLVGLLIGGKFFMIFSFLFGLSFYIQFSRSGEENNFALRFAWRLVILFAIGMLHHLHYRGDILTIYALLGFTLLLFYRLPDKYLLALALMLIFDIPSLITRGVQVFFPGPNPFSQNQEAWMAYYQVLKSGSYTDILRANWPEFFTKMQFQVWSGRIYITEGLFLLGIYAGRKRFFEDAVTFLPLMKKLLRWSLWSILGCVITAALIFGGAHLLQLKLQESAMWMMGGFIMDVFNAALASIYVMSVLLLLQREKWRQRLMVLFPVGKMGLTTYLLQTVFGTLLFFGYGFHLLFDFGAFYCLLLGIAFFALQTFLAQWWFRHFAYGPVEWLWRSLSQLKIQKMTVTKADATV